MSIKKLFFILPFISLFISSGLLWCQTDTLDSIPQMFEMKNGEIFFGNIINNDEYHTVIEELSGKTIKLLSSDIKKTSCNWKNSVRNYIRIILTDGTELTGMIEDYKDNFFIVRNTLGIEMKVPPNKIGGIKKLSGKIVGGTYRRFDPNRTRLFLAPTARSLNAGEGYFSDYMVFFPFVAVGITDFASISGGMSLIPGADEQMLYGNLKLTLLQKDNFSLSAGALYMHIFDFSSGIIYGVSTIGNNDNALTVGIGNGFSGDDGFSSYPLLVLGGELRVSNSVKLISENWIPTDGTEAVLSFGLRFFGDHVAGDFGLITTSSMLSSSSGFPFIPWLAFTYNFGH